METGEVRRVDPVRLALFINEGIHAVVMRRLSETAAPDPGEEADWIATVAISGACPGEARR